MATPVKNLAVRHLCVKGGLAFSSVCVALSATCPMAEVGIAGAGVIGMTRSDTPVAAASCAVPPGPDHRRRGRRLLRIRSRSDDCLCVLTHRAPDGGEVVFDGADIVLQCSKSLREIGREVPLVGHWI